VDGIRNGGGASSKAGRRANGSIIDVREGSRLTRELVAGLSMEGAGPVAESSQGWYKLPRWSLSTWRFSQ
jgi:hypothetical protein